MTAPIDEAPVCFARACRMAARSVTRLYNARLRWSGLQVTQLSLLIAIARGGDRTLSDFAERLALERTTLLRNLDGLAGAGLVREDDATAGRGKRYRLTPEGEAALARAMPLWREAQAAIAAELGPGADAARAALATLRRAADAAAAEGGSS